jgi:vacuolar-type H+-ATPase subunit B/Vma2
MVVSPAQTKLGEAISEKTASAVDGMYTLFEGNLLPIFRASGVHKYGVVWAMFQVPVEQLRDRE